MERVHGVWYGDMSGAWRFSLPFYKSKKNSLKPLEGLEHILFKIGNSMTLNDCYA